MRFFPMIALLLLGALPVLGAVDTREITYRDGKTVLMGYMAKPRGLKASKALPGVLIVHEWYGHNDYVRQRAEQIAELGYVAFALDMYGKGVLGKDHKEAGELAGPFKEDRKLMRRRARAGLDTLLGLPNVDPNRLAALGYCFGGTTALELARDGADLKGVVSFHGGLETPMPMKKGAFDGKLLVLAGGDDPYVKDAEMHGLIKEMRQAEADWELVLYGGAVHAFTNPAAGDDPSKGAAHNPQAEKRSWEAMRDFLKEVF